MSKDSFWGDLYGKTQLAWKGFWEAQSARDRDSYMKSGWYDRMDAQMRSDCRNGFYERDYVTRLGTIRVQVILAQSLPAEEVTITPLDEQLSGSCGELCGATSSADIVDASVVILARQWQAPILPSDASDLGACMRLPTSFPSKTLCQSPSAATVPIRGDAVS